MNVADPAFGQMPWRDFDAARAHADRFFPFLDAFVSEYDLPDRRFVVEGVEFLPQQAARLGMARSLRCCFLGLSECSVDALELEGAGNWIWDAAPAERSDIAADIVELSQWLQAECKRLGLPFVDMIGDRRAALERAYAVLMGASFKVNEEPESEPPPPAADAAAPAAEPAPPADAAPPTEAPAPAPDQAAPLETPTPPSLD